MSNINTAPHETFESRFTEKSFSLLTTMILSTNYFLLISRSKNKNNNCNEFTHDELLESLNKEKNEFLSGQMLESALSSIKDLYGERIYSADEIMNHLVGAYSAVGESIKEMSYIIQGDNSLPNLETMIKAIEKLLKDKVSVTQSRPSKNGRSKMRFAFEDSLVAYRYGIRLEGKEIVEIIYQETELDAWVPTTRLERDMTNVAARSLMGAYYKKSKK